MIINWFKKTFTRRVEPVLVADFPKDKYNAYWEIIAGDHALEVLVRFYSRVDGSVSASNVKGDSFDDLEQKISKLVRNKMEKYKK